jgi:DNA (cytosine-5)-methyltransferase 1
VSRPKLNILSLFAGIGGLELGLERAGMTTVGQVEIDPYCQLVLARHWPEVPRHDDVRTAPEWWASEPRPRVDVVCGGFPCQDISVAGLGAGILEGERSSLWNHMARTIRALRPRYVLVENVSALLVRGLDVVLADLAASGYDADWDCIPASALGAPHRRDRIWIVAADTDSLGLRQQSVSELRGGDQALADDDGAERIVANTNREPAFRSPVARPERQPWTAEPDLARVADGVPFGVDRRRALGNAVVPQVAEHVGRLIVEDATWRAEAAA